MKKIILTGSEGFLGKTVAKHISGQENVELIPLDIQLGHDLCDEAFVKKFFSENKADYLINMFAMNDHVEKGKEQPNSLFDVSLQSIQQYFDINVSALFSVCREFAKNNTGAIINFSSIYGMVSPRNDMYGDKEKHIGYSISKGAVLQLTKHLAVHLAPDVRVNCVVPGGVEKDQSIEFQKLYAKNCPTKRMMKPDELNGLIDYLCSQNSSYLTGSIIPVDGGWTAW